MRSTGGKASRRLLATLIILLMLIHEFHPYILAFASTGSLVSTPVMAKDDKATIEFLGKQLEKAIPPEGSAIERRYIIPNGMNLSDADGIWASIAPLISLGYGEEELVESLSGLGLPKKFEVDNAIMLIDYSSLRVACSMENGEVSVEVPIICNKSLSSTYYEVTGVKRLVKLFNVTFVRRYEISVNAAELFNITYGNQDTGESSKAITNFSSDLKTHLVQAYLPGLKSPASSEVRIDLPPYGVTLSFKTIEHKASRIRVQGKEADCHWIRVRVSLRASGKLGGMLSIGHSGGWTLIPWFLPQAGEHVSEKWMKWVEGDEFTVKISFGRLDAVFSLVLGSDHSIRQLQQDFRGRPVEGAAQPSSLGETQPQQNSEGLESRARRRDRYERDNMGPHQRI